MNDPIQFPAPTTYQPSVFYFRRKLRNAPDRKGVIHEASIVCAELERLKEWSTEMGVLPAGDWTAAANLLRDALQVCGSRDQAVLLGLFLCHELEGLKAAVRDVGLIPPKWHVDEDELAEKGWADTGTSQEP
jgi:hypothetical protein